MTLRLSKRKPWEQETEEAWLDIWRMPIKMHILDHSNIPLLDWALNLWTIGHLQIVYITLLHPNRSRSQISATE